MAGIYKMHARARGTAAGTYIKQHIERKQVSSGPNTPNRPWTSLYLGSLDLHLCLGSRPVRPPRLRSSPGLRPGRVAVGYPLAGAAAHVCCVMLLVHGLWCIYVLSSSESRDAQGR